MNALAKSAFALGAVLASSWIASSAAQAGTFDLGSIHTPGWVGLSQSQSSSGAPGIIDFPADEYKFTVDGDAKLDAKFGLLLIFSQQTPSDHVDISLYEADVSGTHLLAANSGVNMAAFLFDVHPGHFYSFLVATAFSNNEDGGYGGILNFAVAPTPIPAALPLFVSALGGLGVVAWRRHKNARFGRRFYRL
jgi:hypothetical protein